MHLRHHTVAIGAFVLLAVGHAPLGAQVQRTQEAPQPTPLTLHVPLQLQNIDPKAAEAVVFCKAIFLGNNDPHMNQIVQDSVPISGGAYDGSVDLKFSLPWSKLGNKWKYDCRLELSSAALKQTYYAGLVAWAAPKAGTTSSLEVTGTITTTQ